VREIWETPRGVQLHPPTSARPYFRIVYRDRNGQRHQPSGGKDQKGAWAKACEIDRQLELAVTDKSERTVAELRDAFLADMTPHWSPRHAQDTGTYLDAALVDLLASPCWELTRDDIAAAINRGATARMRQHYRAPFGKMISWGYDEEWVPQPREALVRRKHKTARAEHGRAHGEAHEYVNPRLIPSADDVRRVADAMYTIGGPKNGERAWLMTAIAASCGLRWGELADLRAGRLNFDQGDLHVLTQVVWLKKDHKDATRPYGPIQTPPKWGRVRTTVLPKLTLWGEPLRDRLGAYMAARELGPDDLLFPNADGGWVHASNHARDLWTPAREATPGWAKSWTWHGMRHAFCSHLIATRASVADVSLAAGHRDTGTTLRMYVSATRGTTGRLNTVLGG
jgi:integrase